MTTRRVAAAVIAIVLAGTTACGDDDDVRSAPTSVAESAERTSGDSDEERCEALRALAEAQPPAGNLDAEEFAAAYQQYADAAEQAAEASDGPDQRLLEEFAELMRTIGSDPAADVADDVARLADPMQDLAATAQRECDVSLGLLAG